MYFIKTIGNYNVFITDIPVFIYAHKIIVLDDIKFDMSDNAKDVLHRLEIKHVNDVTEYNQNQDIYYLRRGDIMINLVRKYVPGSIKLFIDGIENFDFAETSELVLTLTNPIIESKSVIFVQYTDPDSTQSPPTNINSSWKEPVATFSEISIKYPNPSEGWVVTVSDSNNIYRYDMETNSWIYVNKNDLINFTSLADVPNDYVTNGGKFVKVKSTEDGLEFGEGAIFYTEGLSTEDFEDDNLLVTYAGGFNRDTSNPHSGLYSLKSNTALTEDGESISFVATFDGMLSFWYKSTITYQSTSLTVYLDGTALFTSGNADWTLFSKPILKGNHTISVNHSSTFGGRSTLYIDDFSFPSHKIYNQNIAEHSGIANMLGNEGKLVKVNNAGNGLDYIDYPTTNTYTANITALWTGTQAPYTQTIVVEGIQEIDNPVCDLILTGIYINDLQIEDAWSNIYRITTANNSITLYSHSIINVPFNIQLKVVK